MKQSNDLSQTCDFHLSLTVQRCTECLDNQEKAKEWDKATTLDSYEEFLIQKEIVERLKKRTEECETNSLKISMKDNWAEYKNQITLLPELQKILGEEK